MQKSKKYFCRIKYHDYLCALKMSREHSSAGSEHLPYKQRAGGSNPSAPTVKIKALHDKCKALVFCSQLPCQNFQDWKVILRKGKGDECHGVAFWKIFFCEILHQIR